MKAVAATGKLIEREEVIPLSDARALGVDLPASGDSGPARTTLAAGSRAPAQ